MIAGGCGLPAQVQGQRERWIRYFGFDVHRTRRMAVVPETCDAPRFGFVGIDGPRAVAATARMRDVVCAAADGTLAPGINNVEYQRRMYADRRMQCGRRAPRAEAYPGDKFSGCSRRRQRQCATVAGDDVAGLGLAATSGAATGLVFLATPVEAVLLPLALLAMQGCTDPAGTSGTPPLITQLPRQLSAAEQNIVQSTPDFAVNSDLKSP